MDESSSNYALGLASRRKSCVGPERPR